MKRIRYVSFLDDWEDATIDPTPEDLKRLERRTLKGSVCLLGGIIREFNDRGVTKSFPLRLFGHILTKKPPQKVNLLFTRGRWSGKEELTIPRDAYYHTTENGLYIRPSNPLARFGDIQDKHVRICTTEFSEDGRHTHKSTFYTLSAYEWELSVEFNEWGNNGLEKEYKVYYDPFKPYYYFWLNKQLVLLEPVKWANDLSGLVGGEDYDIQTD